MGEERSDRFIGDLAASYRARAAEARARALLMSRDDVRKAMLRRAEMLEKMARQAEQDASYKH